LSSILTPSGGDMRAIVTNNLAKQYDQGVLALSSLSLEVDEGIVFGFLGPNGAGKTTTVRLLNGTLTPTSGTFSLFSKEQDPQAIRLVSATLSEGAKMYETLTAVENLRFFGRLYGLEEQNIADRSSMLLKKLGLEGREHEKVGTYSTGMKKRVQLARTLLHRPKLLFLDEPTSGLDPQAAGEVSQLIRNVAREEGTTVFLCTHNLPVAEKVCDQVAFLDRGKLVAFGSRDDLASRLGKGKVLEMLLLNPDSGEEKRECKPILDHSEINLHIREAINRNMIVLESKIQRPDLEELYFSYIGEKK
jgi:ABC-2 type transport system ATP-binding protein